MAKKLERGPSLHPIRPVGDRSFRDPGWQDLFEGFDAAVTGVTIEVRYPYLDLRLLRFLLAVPALPWCRTKYLVRQALQGLLPAPVLSRPKTPLHEDPGFMRVRARGMPSMPLSEDLARYVNLKRIPSGGPQRPADYRTSLRPLALEYWMAHSLKRQSSIEMEECNEL